jgi:hypothetical protein
MVTSGRSSLSIMRFNICPCRDLHTTMRSWFLIVPCPKSCLYALSTTSYCTVYPFLKSQTPSEINAETIHKCRSVHRTLRLIAFDSSLRCRSAGCFQPSESCSREGSHHTHSKCVLYCTRRRQRGCCPVEPSKPIFAWIRHNCETLRDAALAPDCCHPVSHHIHSWLW